MGTASEDLAVREQFYREANASRKLNLYVKNPTQESREAWLAAERLLASPIPNLEYVANPVEEEKTFIDDEQLEYIIGLFKNCGRKSPLHYAASLGLPGIRINVILLIWSEHCAEAFWDKVRRYPLSDEEVATYGRFVDLACMQPIADEGHYTGLEFDYKTPQSGRAFDSDLGMLVLAARASRAKHRPDSREPPV